MAYDFRSLLPADFEDMVRDLAGKALGFRFEAFGPGPDSGIDGRHSAATGDVILQAKHMVDSSFAKLKSTMARERKAIDQLEPNRYVLATSRSLTPANKAALATEIGPALRNESDILGPGDLNAILRDHPKLERAHLKLWLSSTVVLDAVLDSIVHAAIHAFTATTRAEIAAKVRVYAQNPSLANARTVLDRRHVLIISGPPGVGKTTLAEILALAYLGDGWEFVAIHSLEDGFTRIDDAKRQIFFFDDFLGSIALDHRALAAKDNALAQFLRRVQKSPNARFILTTRAYILNEAKSVSERLSDKSIDLSTYVLDLSHYTRAIRARILYNHLIVGQVPKSHVLSLLDSGKLSQIVDHPNYNPRVIEWMTEAMRLEDIPAREYSAAFLEALANPKALWDKAFRTHISAACRHILLVLFFTPGFGCKISDLRAAFETTHARLCCSQHIIRDPKDFEDSLRRVEGGFVNIHDQIVDFINPSMRDYLADYLADGSLLADIAGTVTSGPMARQIWIFAQRSLQHSPSALRRIAAQFLPMIERFGSAPRDLYKNVPHGDIDIAERLELLLTWWAHSGNEQFITAALMIAKSPPDSFLSWRDAPLMIKLVAQLDDPGYYERTAQTRELKSLLEDVLVALVVDGLYSDDLLKMSDAIEENWKSYGAELVAVMRRAIVNEFDNVKEICMNFTSESELDDHVDLLNKLAGRANVSKPDLDGALNAVADRLSQVQEEQTVSVEPEVLKAPKKTEAKFDDVALRVLFDGLR